MSKNKVYPECEKLACVKDKSQVIHEFIKEFLSEKGIMLGSYIKVEREAVWEDLLYKATGKKVADKYFTEDFMPFTGDLSKLVAEFFDIDLDVLENEKREILADVRKRNR